MAYKIVDCYNSEQQKDYSCVIVLP